jgi:uncharacterized protein YndB with AHSA1/START domain
MSLDRIEKRVVLLRAPVPRVWRALTDAEEFGRWFGVRLEGPFVAGSRVRGQITVAGHEHVTLDITIERLEPERYFSWRWHPYAVEPGVDYSGEPTTRVEFTFEEAGGGTRLTVVESGFDAIPLARRAKAFEMNEGGWTQQLRNVERHVGAS